MIKIENLTKYFGKIKALDNLNLHIKKGEIFGLLGPNGAGKTTTIQILTTLLSPSSGKIEIDGLDIIKNANKIKQLIGVCPQEINLDKDLSAKENLHIHGLLYKISKIDNKINDLLEWANLKNRKNNLVSTYSGGMQRRLLIIRSIMHQPKILFLDEPTIGLDPQIKRQIWDIIRKLNKEGTTILLTTHYIEETEILCHRVGILNYGKLIAMGTPQEIKAQIGHFVVESFDNGITNYHLFENREEAYKFAENKNNILIRASNLEDVFIKITGKKIKK
ncbi:MAG: ATP-binding cassette domain-containing protein [bacterium]